MCSKRTASAIAKMAKSGNRFFDNGGMLTVLTLTRTQRKRTKVTKEGRTRTTEVRGQVSMARAHNGLETLCVVAFVCLCVRVLFSAFVPLSGAQSQLTFYQHIAPLVWHRCSPCHRPGEVAPFSLMTYDDVRSRAAQIATVTARRIMPPWKPEPGKGEFRDVRRLTDRELGMLQQWIVEGAAEGDRAHPSQMPRWND